MEEYPNHNDKTQTHVILTKGTMVTHYRIIEKIGAGGMGEVYLAEDTRLIRNVALKFLSPYLCQDKDFRSRFTREAQAAAKLDHPNIVTIHEVSEFQGRPFFAMQYIEGQSTRECIESGVRSSGQVVDFVIQICDGLRAAHHSGIIHRDIKPANILIGRDGRPKLLDFGLAMVEGSEKLTKPGSIAGTVGYLAPEILKGKQADQRTDIFSLGVVIYELFTGQQPFRRGSEAATINAILNETPEPLGADVPVGLQKIVDKTLDKNPVTRYQHIDDLLTDLSQVKHDTHSPWIGGWSKVPPTSLRRIRLYPKLVGSLALVVLLMLWYSGKGRDVFYWLGFGGVPNTIHLAVLPFTNIGGTASSQAFCDGLLETLTSKLTLLEQYQGPLWVVPASEVREVEIASPSGARRAFGATLAVTGSFQYLDSSVRLTLNLVDTKTDRQLRSSIIDDSMISLSALQDSTMIKLVRMLEVELQPKDFHLLTEGGTNVPEAYNLYLQGRGYLQRFQKVENIDTAIVMFQNAVAKDPQYALAYAGLGEAYWRKYEVYGDQRALDLSIYNSQHAVELNDQLTPVYITLGLVHSGTGRYEQAIEDFGNALTLDSVSHRALRGLATVYESLGRLDSAESIYRRVVELKPDYWSGNLDLGFFYVTQGRREDALDQARKVQELEPDGFVAWNNLGALYYYLDLWSDARAMWERSLEIEPNYGAYSNLGSIHYMEGRYVDAAYMCEQALEANDRDYLVWGNLASAYYWIAGKRQKSLATYRRAIQMAEEQRNLHPQELTILSALAEYYAAIKDTTKALSFAQEAISIAPNDVEVMITMGLVNEWLGKRDAALNWVTEALQHGYELKYVESLPIFQQLLTDPRLHDLLETTRDEPHYDSGDVK